MISPLPLLNKLLYTSDMIGGQAVAQAGNLWLLFFWRRHAPRVRLTPCLASRLAPSTSMHGCLWGFC